MEVPEDSRLRRPILTIQNSGERAAAIVQDLLTLERRGVAATQVVSLNHVISEIVSGFSETKRVKEAQKLGAGSYVKKPYTLDKLGTAVKNGLSK
jgi:signal transduction histidine kinase